MFAGTEEGIYHSPNGGRGWKRSESEEAVFQAITVDPNFHRTGVVLAGTEGDGLLALLTAASVRALAFGALAQINAGGDVARLAAQRRDGLVDFAGWPMRQPKDATARRLLGQSFCTRTAR